MRRLTCVVIGLLLLSGIAPWALAGPKDEVASAGEQWAKDFSGDTPDALLALYDKEAALWGTVSPKLRADPSAIREYFQAGFERLPQRKVTFGEQFIRVYGDTAINTGYYTFWWINREGKEGTLPARYSLVYVKRNGKWLIVDHHSSAVPTPP